MKFLSVHNHETVMDGGYLQLLLAAPFVLGLIIYLLILTKRKDQQTWPLFRTVSWIGGCILAIGSVAGPVAELAHHDFRMHMVSHLLLGMLAPLLLVLAAPMTLVLSTWKVEHARTLSRLLRSRYSQFVTHPVVATALNIGGLAILYRTNLYSLMHEHMILYVVVHAHVFLAGYFFTVSMIYVDPTPHRESYLFRAIVLICALAGHGILSKHIYAYPPAGIPVPQAEQGAMLMYYGGDAIDALIIFFLCLQWFKATRPKSTCKEKKYSFV
ncbi:putative membrane protein [Halobacillus dabanensis]|uniref:Putative membrane protein n=1 Tax=Halobacillus dabanensis TaxID=240302 RepID=A0A1I3ZKL4_HALDA|nr:cytochrome c oxidase assembly protein [Halobacillus dabanensis]SFK44587.1 putative membrane protein [Halobacillus dabanensis]